MSVGPKEGTSSTKVWERLQGGIGRRGVYEHPGGLPLEYWYECPIRGLIVNLIFVNCSPTSPYDHQSAMRYAYEHHTTGVKIWKRNGLRGLQFEAFDGTPVRFGFNTDYQAVSYDELSCIDMIKDNISVVIFQNVKYVHKFMDRTSCQRSFETEVRRYQQLNGYDGVLELKAVVRRNDRVQGLLIPFIEGDELWNLVKGGQLTHELLHVTDRIIEIARNLEKAGVYHEDLKCENIIRRKSDGLLFFVDFGGGITKGFYREEASDDLLDGKIHPREALYILGKTLLQLWTAKHPQLSDQLSADDIPVAVRSTIVNCIDGGVDTVDELFRKHVCNKVMIR